jgi:hypothetical protein
LIRAEDFAVAVANLKQQGQDIVENAGQCFRRDGHVHAEDIAWVGKPVGKLIKEAVASCKFEGGDCPDV